MTEISEFSFPLYLLKESYGAVWDYIATEQTQSVLQSLHCYYCFVINLSYFRAEVSKLTSPPPAFLQLDR